MYDSSETKNYIKKLHKVLNTPGFTLFGKYLVKKNRIDDLLCCIIASFPETYKKALKNRTLRPDQFQSVAAFNRLSKLIKNPAVLLSSFYTFKISEVNELIKLINKNLELDIYNLEKR